MNNMKFSENLFLLTGIFLLLSGGCTKTDLRETGVQSETIVRVIPEAGFGLKAAFGEEVENIISDLNLYIFDRNGVLIAKEYVEGSSLKEHPDGYEFSTDKLYERNSYTFLAFANMEENFPEMNLADLKKKRFYMAYPDEISRGMPMSCILDRYKVRSGEPVNLKLENMMAKVTIKVDRKNLDGACAFNVRSVHIGASPRFTPVMGTGRVESASDCFSGGYALDELQADRLNRNDYGTVSQEVHLYVLENRQGTLLPGNSDPRTKILGEESPYRNLCSYIEIRADYTNRLEPSQDGVLKYRFYLGENAANFDVCRGCHYRITVLPSGNGMSGNSWRTELIQ